MLEATTVRTMEPMRWVEMSDFEILEPSRGKESVPKLGYLRKKMRRKKDPSPRHKLGQPKVERSAKDMMLHRKVKITRLAEVMVSVGFRMRMIHRR